MYGRIVHRIYVADASFFDGRDNRLVTIDSNRGIANPGQREATKKIVATSWAFFYITCGAGLKFFHVVKIGGVGGARLKRNWDKNQNCPERDVSE